MYSLSVQLAILTDERLLADDYIKGLRGAVYNSYNDLEVACAMFLKTLSRPGAVRFIEPSEDGMCSFLLLFKTSLTLVGHTDP